MKIALVAALLFSATSSYAQISGDFLLAGHIDLIKSDNDGYFEKVQGSAELNYFLSRKFTVTAGAELWTEDERISLVMGARWYPVEEAFIRARGLIGANVIVLGGGWARPVGEHWRFEAIGEVNTDGHIAIRAGFSHLLRRRAD